MFKTTPSPAKVIVPKPTKNSVTTDAIVDGAVTTAKIDDGAVTEEKLAANVIQRTGTFQLKKVGDTTTKTNNWTYYKIGNVVTITGTPSFWKTQGSETMRIASIPSANGLPFTVAGTQEVMVSGANVDFTGGQDICWLTLADKTITAKKSVHVSDEGAVTVGNGQAWTGLPGKITITYTTSE